MLWILDSHPVQYRAPLYRELQRLELCTFKVVYATDVSTRGYFDPSFQRDVRWDVPLLEGYDFHVLNNERGVPLNGFRSLHGGGIFRLLKQERPSAVLFAHFQYEFELVAYLSCLALSIPIWIRQETQDEAFKRSRVRSAVRHILYRLAYLPVKRAFFIGRLNKDHYLRHGIPPRRLFSAPYCVDSPCVTMATEEKLTRRLAMRERLGVQHNQILVGFSGKFIPKKDPLLLVEAVRRLQERHGDRYCVVFVGDGELRDKLRESANHALSGTVAFPGFVNQSRIVDYYLAMDVFVLPSRRRGETWGLVVNEALHAGCAVAISDAVGCHAEFGDWERVRVFPEQDAVQLAAAIEDLSRYERDVSWCQNNLTPYTVQAVARALASAAQS